MKKYAYIYIIFFCCLLLGWSNVCLGGDVMPSEIFPGYIQEEYAPESFPEYKEAWDSSFVASQREIKNSEVVKKFIEKFKPLKDSGLSKSLLNKIRGRMSFLLKYTPEKKGENHWQTFSQFLNNDKGGDCEEFAISEIIIIKSLFPEAEIYFAFGYKKAFLLGDDEDHSVAIVKIQEEFFILDFDRDTVNTEKNDYFIPYLLINIQSGNFYALYPNKSFHGQVARVE